MEQQEVQKVQALSYIHSLRLTLEGNILHIEPDINSTHCNNDEILINLKCYSTCCICTYITEWRFIINLLNLPNVQSYHGGCGNS